MKKNFCNIAVVCIFIFSFGLYAISQADISKALDLGSGIKIIELGQYKGKNPTQWTLPKKGKIPASRTNIENPSGIDNVLVGDNCLQFPMPTTACGYGDMINLRSRNYFVVQVQGEGELTFNYRTSMDGQQDEKFIAYIYNGSNNAQLKADDYDYPEESGTLVTTSYYAELFKDSGTWEKVYSDDGEKIYDIDGDNFWQEGSINLDSETPIPAYTRNIVFAVVGKASKDSWGDNFEIDKDVMSNEEVLNCVFLDNLQWTPSEIQPQKVIFEPEPIESGFQKPQMIILNSDYEDSVFDFYFTTDGTTPTKKSKKYEETLDEESNTIVSNITLSDTTTLKVAVFEKGTQYNNSTAGISVAEVVTQEYVFIFPAPTVTMKAGDAFKDETIFTITGDYYDDVTFVYTLDGSTPSANSTVISGTTLTLPNNDLDGKALKIAACSGQKVSDAVSFTLKRVAKPNVVFQLDGVEAEDSDFIFDDKVTWTVPSGCVIAPAILTALTSDGSVSYYAPGSDTTLPSVICERYFVKTTQKLSLTKDAIIDSTIETTDEEWMRYAVPKQVSVASGKKLAEWLQPYEYDSANKCYRRGTCIANGVSYWIYLANVNWENTPEIKCTANEPAVEDDLPAFKYENGRFILTEE